MADASVGEALISAVRLTVDGRGSVLHLAAGTEVALGLLLEQASDLGLGVLDIKSSEAVAPFAFGAIYEALDAADSSSSMDSLEAFELPDYVARWLEGDVVIRLAEMSARGPIIVIIRDVAKLDRVAGNALDSLMTRFAREPVLWLVCGTPEFMEPPEIGVSREKGLRSLAEEAVLILELIALADMAPTISELARMSGTAAREARSVVHELSALRIIVESGSGCLAFVNTSLRSAIRDSVPHAIQRDTRRAWIDVFLDRSAPAILLAKAALDVGRVGDTRLANVLRAAMAALRDDEPDTAAVIGLGAANILTDPSEDLTAHVWDLLPLLWQTSRTNEARQLARRVFADRGQGEVEAQVLFWLARFEGSAERSVRLTQDALAIPGISDAITAKLLGVRVRCLSTLGRRREVDRELPRALELAAGIGDWETLSRLQSSDAIRDYYAGHYATSQEKSDLAQRSFERSGVDQAEWMPELIWRPFLTFILGDVDSARKHCDRLLDEFEPLGQVSATRFLHSLRAMIALAMGNIAEASDEALAATNVSLRLWGLPAGASDRLQSIALGVRLKVALHRGDAQEIEDLRIVLRGLGSDLSAEADARVDWWQFLLDDAQAPRRQRTSSSALIDVSTTPHVSWLDPTDEMMIFRALLRAGHDDAAKRLLRTAIHRRDMNTEQPLARAIAENMTGLVEDDSMALVRAKVDWDKLGRPLLAAGAGEDAARLDLRHGRASAVDSLIAIHDVFERAGALHDAARVRRTLRDAGHSIRGHRVRQEAYLTPAETRVVTRAVQGATAAQIGEELFLSPHTVVSHLRSVYRKLGLRSRRELTRWAEEAGQL